MNFLSMFSSIKFWIMMGLAVGIGIAGWYAIKTWRDDIRKMVFNELFADLVVQTNEANAKAMLSLQQQLKDLEASIDAERQARIAADNRADAIRRRTEGLANGRPSPLMLETMKVIYEQQGDKK